MVLSNRLQRDVHAVHLLQRNRRVDQDERFMGARFYWRWRAHLGLRGELPELSEEGLLSKSQHRDLLGELLFRVLDESSRGMPTSSLRSAPRRVACALVVAAGFTLIGLFGGQLVGQGGAERETAPASNARRESYRRGHGCTFGRSRFDECDPCTTR